MAMRVRPMLSDDVEAAALAGAAGMEFSIPAADWARWCERLGYLLGPDPGGAFVAESEGQVLGVAQAMQRDGLWILSFFAVAPAGQAQRRGPSPAAGCAGLRRPVAGSDRQL